MAQPDPDDREILYLDLHKGMNSKSDPKEILSSDLISLQNAVFDDGGVLNKRYGYQVLGNTDFGSNTITNGSALAIYNNELVELANGQFYSMASSFSKFANKGPAVPLTATADPVTRNTFNQILADCETVLGITVYFYQDGRNGTSGGVRATIVEEATGNQLVSDVQISATGFLPKLIAITSTNKIGMLWSEGVNIKAVLYDPTAPTTIPAASTIFNDGVVPSPATSGTAFEAIWSTAQGSVYIVYFSTTFANIRIVKLSAVLAVQASANFAAGTALANACYALCYSTQNTDLIIAWANCATGNTVRVTVYSGNLGSVVLAPTAVTSLGGLQLIKNVALHEVDATHFAVMWEDNEPALGVDPTSSQNVQQIGRSVVTYAGAFSAATILRTVGLASSVLTLGGVNYYVITYSLQSPSICVQPTYFVMTELGVIVGRFQPLNAGGFIFDTTNNATRLPGFGALSATKFAYPAIVQGQIQAVNGQISTVTGVTKETLNFGPLPAFTKAQLGQDLHLSGSMMTDYDGAGTVEHGFHVFPEQFTFGAGQPFAVSAISDSSPPFSTTVAAGTTTIVDVPGEAQWPRSSYFSIETEANGGGGVVKNGVVIVLRIGGIAPTFTHAYDNSVTVTLPSGATGHEVAILLCAAVGQLFVEFQTNVLGPSSIIQGGWQFEIINTQKTIVVQHGVVSNSALTIFVTQGKQNSGTKVIWFGSFPDGAFIGNSQYFVACRNLAGVAQYEYFWYHITGLPTVDPAPGNFLGTVLTAGRQIDILASDTGDVVAAKTSTALVAQGYTVASADGNTLNTISYAAGVGPTFQFMPQNVTVGGRIGDGQFQYKAVYRWQDSQGQIHQSSPSAPFTANIFSSGQFVPANGSQGTTGLLRIFAPMLRLTSKVPPRAKVTIEIYRTQANQPGPYYRITSPTNPIYNDPTQDFALFLDTVSDGSLIGNEQLYTEGGVLPNFPPPPQSIVVNHRNRLWVFGLEDRSLVSFSKTFKPGSGVAFVDPNLFGIRFDLAGGPITAAATLDDKLIVFKESQVWFIAGDGPDDTGQNGYFSAPQLLTTESGCNSASGVVLTPDGLMYTSDKGIYIINRALQTSFIGASIDLLKTSTFTSAAILPDRQQVRFLASSGNAALFDYYYGQWGLLTNHAAVDALVWQNHYCYLLANGQVFQETPGAYLDNGAGIAMQVETAWVRADVQQDFQRIFKALFLGVWQQTQTVQLQVAYDYDDSTFTPISWIAVPQGRAGSLVGTNPTVLQWRADMPRQKCMSIKFKIIETTPQNLNFQLAGIGIEVRKKANLNRIAYNNAVG